MHHKIIFALVALTTVLVMPGCYTVMVTPAETPRNEVHHRGPRLPVREVPPSVTREPEGGGHHQIAERVPGYVPPPPPVAPQPAKQQTPRPRPQDKKATAAQPPPPRIRH